jgi:hypothetical protein
MANVILPSVKMFIPCLDLDVKPVVVIYSPVHTIRMPPGVTVDYLLDEIWFYVALTDAVGRFRLSVEMLGEEEIILARSEIQTSRFSGGMQLREMIFGFSIATVPLPRPGLYEFRLVANHTHLRDGGTAILRVLPG